MTRLCLRCHKEPILGDDIYCKGCLRIFWEDEDDGNDNGTARNVQ
jgi:hypothetical protein